jgi:hypothetical protein
MAYPGDSVRERQDLQESFRNCELFMRVWDDSAKGVPIDLAVVVIGVALILAVCWLDHRTKDEGDVEIETPFLSLRRGSSKRAKQKKGDAKT